MFKRLLVLAAGLCLFIICFTARSYLIDTGIENNFQRARIENHVEGVDLTSAQVIPPAAPVSTPASRGDTAAPVPESSTNDIIIGPLPPSRPPEDDAAPASGGDSNAPTSVPGPVSVPVTDPHSPPASAPSTLLYPRLRTLPFALFSAYTPAGNLKLQATTMPPLPAPSKAAPSTPAPSQAAIDQRETSATGTGVHNAPTNAPTAGTNAAPYDGGTSEAGGAKPVPIEASVIILGYHQFVGPGQSSRNPYVMRQDVFESEIKYLKDNGYHIVPLTDVIRFIKHEIGLPPNSVAITIDDGYKSAIVWAAPILKQYGFPWTYFVYPDFITVAEGKGAASWNDLLQLQADGVDVESHSMTHPQLTKKYQRWPYKTGHVHALSPEEYDAFLTNETAGAKELLEQHLNKKILFLAYPYGDYNKVVEAKAIAAGYEAIFTVADNPVHESTNVFSVGRYIITQPVEKAFASYLRQGALSVADAQPAAGSTTSDPRPVISAVLGYAGNLNPNSIETEVRDYGQIRHDYDPKTSTVRLYLPRDLIQPVVIVNIRAKDAESGQTMVANWHFNYEPASAAATHAAIVPPTNSVVPQAPTTTTAPVPSTNSAPLTTIDVRSSNSTNSTP